MPKYALDTNVYIDSFRSERASDGLKRFLAANLPTVFLIAVVMQELRAGAHSPEQVEALESGVFTPFERRGRVLTPHASAFKESGRILAELAGRGKTEGSRIAASFANDTLIAACCRDEGITLITRDADHARIARHLKGFRHAFPGF